MSGPHYSEATRAAYAHLAPVRSTMRISLDVTVVAEGVTPTGLVPALIRTILACGLTHECSARCESDRPSAIWRVKIERVDVV